MTKKKAGKKLSTEEKYQYYEATVQNVESDIELIEKEYRKIFKKTPHHLREDFGGTGALACEWVRRDRENTAVAVDLDPEPIEYGKKHHYGKLSEDEQERMRYLKANVLDDMDFKTDVTVAFNFSYFIFKKRNDLLNYFKKVREGLTEEGAFFLDIFGGTECRQELEEETDYDNYVYYWDCDKYNPITGGATYYIHFEDKKKNVKFERVFSYDWRIWDLPEIQDILADAGFSEIKTYWEGDDDDGGGNGEFYESRNEDNCDSWVTYIIALK